MKRLIAVALACAIALTFVSTADAATFVKYQEIGPIPLRVHTLSVTGYVDSVARNFNTACAGGSVDTTVDVVLPPNTAWGAVTDSLPIFVVVRRVGGTGGAADTVQVALDVNYGGSVYPTSRTDAANGWGFSTVALVGTGTGGVAVFKPSLGAAHLLNAINTYTVAARSYGAKQARIVCRSISVAAAAGRYSVFLRVPVLE